MMDQIDLSKAEPEGLYIPKEAPKPEAMRWIPCSEKLPDKDGYYLVYDESGMVRMYVFEISSQSWCGNIFGLKEIAWMPLPCPYKRERDDAESNKH